MADLEHEEGFDIDEWLDESLVTEEFTIDDWIEHLVAADPIAPGPGPQAWERDDILEVLTELLPETKTGHQCLMITEVLGRAKKAQGEGKDLLEKTLARAYRLGMDSTIDQEWEPEWWLSSLVNEPLAEEARRRLLALTEDLSVDEWLLRLAGPDPWEPTREIRDHEWEGVIELLSHQLPRTSIGRQCIAMARLVSRGGTGTRKGEEFLEAALTRAYKLGMNPEIEQEFELEWWVRAVGNFVTSKEAQHRLFLLTGLGGPHSSED